LDGAKLNRILTLGTGQINHVMDVANVLNADFLVKDRKTSVCENCQFRTRSQYIPGYEIVKVIFEHGFPVY
jgi:hypothetical protein